MSDGNITNNTEAILTCKAVEHVTVLHRSHTDLEGSPASHGTVRELKPY